MYLQHITLSNFKSYETAEFDFSANVNGIVGENGSGKTNLLDAIYYLCFCKSFFSSQDQFSVKFDTDFFAIHGDFVNRQQENTTHIGCTYKVGGRKSMKANQKEYDRFSDHIGRYPLVMVSPYDNDIINEGSDTRRRFFDMIISQFDKEYLQQLISYQKIILQRNTLLKSFIEHNNYDPILLEVFDNQLIPLGEYIFQKRKGFIDNILPVFNKHYQYLSQGREEVGIAYESGLQEMSFADGLKNNAITDHKSGYTTFGIHKDDFQFLIDGRSVKRFGSQGQQKSYALSLKLSQFDYIYERKGLKPILLLDDIFDKLDKKRTAQLLDLVGQDHFGQVFITDTDEVRVNEILNARNIEHQVFHITR
ncbi:MAG: DNA replication/repair protein RecF [Bacteroidales bacterium]|nr:DNA replication/repair protein RecF [Bacteroidales bacterium]